MQAQAEEGQSREGKFFIIRQGEMKCEDCWLQIVFAEKVKEMKAEQRRAERGVGW